MTCPRLCCSCSLIPPTFIFIFFSLRYWLSIAFCSFAIYFVLVVFAIYDFGIPDHFCGHRAHSEKRRRAVVIFLWCRCAIRPESPSIRTKSAWVNRRSLDLSNMGGSCYYRLRNLNKFSEFPNHQSVTWQRDASYDVSDKKAFVNKVDLSLLKRN